MNNTLTDIISIDSMEETRLPIMSNTQWVVNSLTKTLPYFELAGYHLELQNHGAPSCPDISLNEEEASEIKPQAWLEIINSQEYWLYNYPGACVEAKYLGKKIPNLSQWMEMFASMPGDVETKIQVLNIPLVGCHSAGDGKVYGANLYADIWSSSARAHNAHFVFLERCGLKVYPRQANRASGKSLRFLSNQK